ncbi:MAG: hypothetical protein ACRD43_09120, partial [Pyrinomonadaceae bacterium]
STPYHFCFESYGVAVRIEASDRGLLNDTERAAKRSLVGNFRIVEDREPVRVYRVSRKNGVYRVSKGGEDFRPEISRQDFLEFFDTEIRITVAEFAPEHVFVHCGVVGWKGKAIVIPASSFKGKTTLVAELVRRGADYYSDEYAVFDRNGLVHPFARKLAMRSRPVPGEAPQTTYLTAKSLGGKAGKKPLSVGCVLVTEFRENAGWKPQYLTSGQGVIEMLSQTLPIRYAPEFCMGVLKKVATSAIIVKSYRFEAEEFANFFLDFIDNKAL